MNYSFNIDYAKEYGVNEAIMIQNFQFWIMKNKANNKNIYDGRAWTFNSMRAYALLFPFWKEHQIRNIVNNLLEKGILIKGNYNKIAYDRTSWYAFNDEEKFISICHKDQMEKTKTSNRIDGNDEPIPYINTDHKPDNISETKVSPVSPVLPVLDLEIIEKDNKPDKKKKKIVREGSTLRSKEGNISLLEIFQKGYKVLNNGEPLSWKRKAGVFGKAITNLIELAEDKLGKNVDDEEIYKEIHTRASILFKKITSDKFYEEQGFTPLTLATFWEKLVPIRTTKEAKRMIDIAKMEENLEKEDWRRNAFR
jgi:hypothetical protein